MYIFWAQFNLEFLFCQQMDEDDDEDEDDEGEDDEESDTNDDELDTDMMDDRDSADDASNCKYAWCTRELCGIGGCNVLLL